MARFFGSAGLGMWLGMWLGAGLAWGQGSPGAYAPENEAALAAMKAGDTARALEIWQGLARAGDARARSNLGILYERGLGVEADAVEAARWFRLAAEAGFAPAQHNLATSYAEGNGVVRDSSAAFGWFRQAALQGYLPARKALVRAFSLGEGTPANPVRAYMWMILLAEAGDEWARANIADIEARLDEAGVKLGRQWAELCASSPQTGCG